MYVLKMYVRYVRMCVMYDCLYGSMMHYVMSVSLRVYVMAVWYVM